MKGSRLFLLAMLLVVAVVILLECNVPRRFVWNPTYSTLDHEPLGCAVFDDVLSRSWPEGYRVTDSTLYQFSTDSLREPMAILMAGERCHLTETDRHALLRLLDRGHTVILAALSFNLPEEVSGFDIDRGWFDWQALRNQVTERVGRDTIWWGFHPQEERELEEAVRLYPPRMYHFYPQFINTSFSQTVPEMQALAVVRGVREVYKEVDKGTRERVDEETEEEVDEETKEVNKFIEKINELTRKQGDEEREEEVDEEIETKEEEETEEETEYDEESEDDTEYFFVKEAYCHPVAVVRPMGKGKLVLATTPLLFTNYGMLDGDNAGYLFRILTEARGLPLCRTQAYNPSASLHESTTPLRYFLSHPPLQWAVYTAMCAVLLFMCFTARRRQRVIPVIRPPENRMLEFTLLIGTLYYQKKMHGDLIRKRYTAFTEMLRREAQLDVEELDNNAFCDLLARKSGLKYEEVKAFLDLLRPILSGEQEADERTMKRCIDEMDRIEQLLT